MPLKSKKSNKGNDPKWDRNSTDGQYLEKLIREGTIKMPVVTNESIDELVCDKYPEYFQKYDGKEFCQNFRRMWNDFQVEQEAQAKNASKNSNDGDDDGKPKAASSSREADEDPDLAEDEDADDEGSPGGTGDGVDGLIRNKQNMTMMTMLNAVPTGDPTIRHVMTEEEAACMHRVLVQQLEEADKNNKITLILSGRTWPKNTLDVLLPPELLERIVPNLVALHVDDTTASLLTADGFAVLQFYADNFQLCPHLRELHLDFLALGTRGINVLRPLLSLPTLCILSLHNSGVAEADVHTLCDILIDRDTGICPLQALTLGRNRTFEEGAVALEPLLAACQHLERFEFIGNSPLLRGSHAIARGLQHSGNVVMRDLALDIQLSDGSNEQDAVMDLCACILRWTNLQRFSITGGELGVIGWRWVAHALRTTNVTLQHLDLGACWLGTEGAQLLGSYLAEEDGRGAQLTYLGLTENELEDQGMEVLAEVFAMLPKLEELILDQNGITANGVRALIETPCPHLRHISVYDNELPQGAVRCLKQMYPKVTADDEEDLEDDGDNWVPTH